MCASDAHCRIFLIIETTKGQSKIRIKRKLAQFCFCVWQRDRGNSNTKNERRKKNDTNVLLLLLLVQSVAASCEMNQCQSKEPLFLHILFVLCFLDEYPERSRMNIYWRLKSSARTFYFDYFFIMTWSVVFSFTLLGGSFDCWLLTILCADM